MKSMSLSKESFDKRKIALEDSDSSSGEDDLMEVDQLAHTSMLRDKPIKKKAFSRAMHNALKKEIRKRKRLSKIGVKGSRRKAQELTERRDQKVQESHERM